jgi:hypothetical protein
MIKDEYLMQAYKNTEESSRWYFLAFSIVCALSLYYKFFKTWFKIPT